MEKAFSYAERLQFPQEAVASLRELWAKVEKNACAKEEFLLANKLFLTEGEQPYKAALYGSTEKAGISCFEGEMLLLLSALSEAKARFDAQGLPESLFFETMSDLKNKLLECKKVHGVWGASCMDWLRNYFFCDRFQLGRLQYEIRSYNFAPYKDFLREGDKVLNCHIPSCGPLVRESVLDSLKRAYDFYPDVRKEGILPVVCSSWLLYPPHGELFAEGSNMKKFYRMFDIVGEELGHADYWRIFGQPYDKEKLASAPEESSLQKSFKAFLLQGNSMGAGKGVLLFDGERILTEKEKKAQVLFAFPNGRPLTRIHRLL